MTTSRILLLVAFAVAGAAAGWAYFAIMRAAVRRAISEKSLDRTFILLLLARVVIFMGGAAAAFWVDALCMVPYLAAFLLARAVVLRRARTEAAPAPTPVREETT